MSTPVSYHSSDTTTSIPDSFLDDCSSTRTRSFFRSSLTYRLVSLRVPLHGTLYLLMAHLRRQDSFDDSDYVSCSVGGDWWRCEDVNYPTFIGCCTSNPCSGRLCPAEDLYPMGFGSVTTPTPDYPNHSCPYGGLWYTCADNSIPFQGCCESNPCNGQGCPAADLRPAGVRTVDVAGGSTFTVPPTVATTVPTTTSTPRPTTSSNTTQDGSTNTSEPSQPKSESNNTAAIAGGAAAVAVVLTMVIGLTFFCIMRRRRRRHLVHDPAKQGAMSKDHKAFHQDPYNSSGCISFFSGQAVY